MKPSASNNPAAKAQESCLRLLKVRDRSEKEIRSRLLQRKFSKNIIDETIRYLKSSRLIDDRQFARNWIQARLNKPYGLKRINFELKQKGISDDLAKEELSRAVSTYHEEEVVLSLIKGRASRYKTLDPLKRKQRLFSYLMQRGFNADISNDGISKYFNTDETNG